MIKSEVKTTCSYCGVGCGIIVKKDNNNKVFVEGDKDHPVNKGMLCSKGMNLHYVANDTSDRILYPEMRWSKSHPRERVSWDDALDRAAAVFKSIIKKHIKGHNNRYICNMVVRKSCGSGGINKQNNYNN